MSKVIFKVTYGSVWDKETKDVGLDGESKTVAASDAEAAIAAVRKAEVGFKVPKSDDDGNDIPGKFYVVTDIRVGSVEKVSDLDIIASESPKTSKKRR